jgi:signal transduction histidine kinase
MDTHFAPAGRAEPEALAQSIRETVQNPIVQVVLESAEGFVMVLDEHRQVLAANPELLQALGLEAEDSILGLRPGELLGCTHVPEGPAGCGTSQTCSQCGAVLAILAAQSGSAPVDGECWLSFQRNGRLEAGEFRVRATPLPLGQHKLIVLVLVDISARKRRDVLESLFHHDVSNTLQGLWAWGEILQGAAIDPKEAGQKILEISLRLKQQLEYHRLLLVAETGTFEVNLETLRIHEVFSRLADLFAPRSLTRERRLILTPPLEEGCVHSDLELVLRILENMVTNALEASCPGEPVEIWSTREDGHASFHVRNPGLLAADVALRIFQRSFSTKSSKGRGLGTYSMKLFGETYLGGRVFFTSRPEEGITFTLSLPTGESH